MNIGQGPLLAEWRGTGGQWRRKAGMTAAPNRRGQTQAGGKQQRDGTTGQIITRLPGNRSLSSRCSRSTRRPPVGRSRTGTGHCSGTERRSCFDQGSSHTSLPASPSRSRRVLQRASRRRAHIAQIYSSFSSARKARYSCAPGGIAHQWRAVLSLAGLGHGRTWSALDPNLASRSSIVRGQVAKGVATAEGGGF